MDQSPDDYFRWMEESSGYILTSELHRGRAEFVDFVQRMVHSLALVEEKELKGPSSLRFFCRVDVGVRRLENGDPKFFVNEVESAHTTSLFCLLGLSNFLTPMMYDLAGVLKQWVLDGRNIGQGLG